jgi:hypothetical protein
MSKPQIPYFLCTLMLGISSILVANKTYQQP